jgi:hypothetical protein
MKKIIARQENKKTHCEFIIESDDEKIVYSEKDSDYAYKNFMYMISILEGEGCQVEERL